MAWPLAALAMLGAGPAAAQDAVALAVSPLPEAERASATVIRVEESGVVTLREGSGPFICIADDPSDDRFQAACYHESLEPYMARGRELRREGVTGRENIAVRREEIEAGTLDMPAYGLLHQLFAPSADWSGDLSAASRLTVIYTPFATAEELGLPARRADGPWFMSSGEANAHIMIPG
ncbi:MAG: hypothetical protein R3266_07315 [Gemmatimonadota bacterium]|nr:hypothetical protein [Gemmatimonadota bacterium]